MKPLNMEALMDLEVPNLSGGELQRVAITLALGKPADVSTLVLVCIRHKLYSISNKVLRIPYY